MIKYWACVLIISMTLLISAFRALPDGYLHVYFLDVGQGDSILIRTPSDQFILIDGGPDDKVLTELNDVMPFYKKRLDFVILTHAHADHINGLVSVLKRYDIGQVLITGARSHGFYYEEFLRIINELNIPLVIAESARDFDFGDFVYLDILYPIESLLGREISNINNSSIVARLLYGENKLLLTGDAEIEVEKEQLMTDFDLRASIYKVGHHGSRNSSSLEYLKEIRPDTAVIQCGIDNKFNHPHPETLINLVRVLNGEIYRNDLQGRVHLIFDQNRLLEKRVQYQRPI